jgi:hypothetical protein
MLSLRNKSKEENKEIQFPNINCHKKKPNNNSDTKNIELNICMDIDLEKSESEMQINKKNFTENKNFTKNFKSNFESSEDFFENFSIEDGFNLEKKFNEFIGDSEDSTEISLIVSNLSLNSDSNNNNYTNQENDFSENMEIFNILMNKKNILRINNDNDNHNNNNNNYSNNTNNFNQRKNLFFNENEKSPPALKKISLTGKVLKSSCEDNYNNNKYYNNYNNNNCNNNNFNSPLKKPKIIRNFIPNISKSNADSCYRNIPERSTNPINSNFDFIQISNFDKKNPNLKSLIL